MTLPLGQIDPADPDVVEQLAVDFHSGHWPEWHKLSAPRQRAFRAKATRTLVRLAALTRVSDAS